MVSGDGLEKKGGSSMRTGWQGIEQSDPRTMSDGRSYEMTRSSVEI